MKMMPSKSLFMTLALVAVSCLLVACDRGDEPIQPPAQKEQTRSSVKFTPKEVRENLSQFLGEMNRQSVLRGGDLRSLDIEDVTLGRSSAFRASTTEETPDSMIYIVTFANDNGYAIVSADKRCDEVLAIVDHGKITDIPESATLKPSEVTYTLSDFAIDYVVYNIKSQDQINIENHGWKVKEMCSPKLKTRWSQRAPYSNYVPDDCPVGCVTVATAQILTYYAAKGGASHQINSLMDWNRLISTSVSNRGQIPQGADPYVLDKIAFLMKWIGRWTYITYTPEGSGTDSKNAMKFLRDQGLVAGDGLHDFDTDKVVRGLRDDKLSYVDGFNGKGSFLFFSWPSGGGHAWVADGFCIAEKNGRTSTLLHFNWGWGGLSDGYFIQGLFNADNSTVPDDLHSALRSESRHDYRFFTEMSHVYPKK